MTRETDMTNPDSGFTAQPVSSRAPYVWAVVILAAIAAVLVIVVLWIRPQADPLDVVSQVAKGLAPTIAGVMAYLKAQETHLSVNSRLDAFMNKDFSIDILGRTSTDSMYDLVAGPEAADVEPVPVPEEILHDIGVPGILDGTPKLSDYGTFVLDEMEVAPDDSGNMNIVGAHEVALGLYYVDELAVDLWASLDAIYAYVQTPTTDGQSAYLVKVSRDDGATWDVLEYMGIAQMLPDGAKNTYDFAVSQGYGKPATRRLPYNEFGIIFLEDVVAGPGQQTVQTASYGAARLGFDLGEFVHVNLGQPDEEYVQVLAADQENQTFTAVFTKTHSTGATVRPTSHVAAERSSCAGYAAN